MKYKDFKTMSQNEMKNVIGGNATATKTACGTCTNMTGSALDKSNVVCTTVPADAVCHDVTGVGQNALHCNTPGGDQINAECEHIGV